ncbi:MAG: hypothetical protein AAFS01_12970 [Pseudomonadota bacterium]
MSSFATEVADSTARATKAHHMNAFYARGPVMEMQIIMTSKGPGV